MGKTVIMALLLASSCAPKKPVPTSAEGRVLSGRASEAVLEVGSEKLSAEQVQARLETIRATLPGAEASDAQLGTVAQFELLADEAERRGYGKDPRVLDAVKDALAAEAADAPEQTLPSADVNEAAVKEAFQEGRKKSSK